MREISFEEGAIGKGLDAAGSQRVTCPPLSRVPYHQRAPLIRAVCAYCNVKRAQYDPPRATDISDGRLRGEGPACVVPGLDALGRSMQA